MGWWDKNQSQSLSYYLWYHKVPACITHAYTPPTHPPPPLVMDGGTLLHLAHTPFPPWPLSLSNPTHPQLRVGGIPVFLVSHDYLKIIVSHPYVCIVTSLVAHTIHCTSCALCATVHTLSTTARVQTSV